MGETGKGVEETEMKFQLLILNDKIDGFSEFVIVPDNYLALVIDNRKGSHAFGKPYISTDYAVSSHNRFASEYCAPRIQDHIVANGRMTLA